MRQKAEKKLQPKQDWKHYAKKAWQFFWKDESVWSWIVNIVVAFVVIRYILYPLLGFVLGTSYPIVAVVSESMEHGLHEGVLCGEQYADFKESFDNYWRACGSWYEQQIITPEQFQDFPFSQGFNKGDVIVLWRANGKNVHVGDILVFQADRPQPIIHRVVKRWEENGKTFYQTKGDHNPRSSDGVDELRISEDRVLGKGLVRVPFLGWLKILFVEALKPLGIVIER